MQPYSRLSIDSSRLLLGRKVSESLSKQVAGRKKHGHCIREKKGERATYCVDAPPGFRLITTAAAAKVSCVAYGYWHDWRERLGGGFQPICPPDASMLRIMCVPSPAVGSVGDNPAAAAACIYL
ncbi:hypothetical protein CABS01_05832 [Colletotrichum abscissum]|uniref:uncharacterized protein n=1 Tax=Colletotrichum abscissum TaxID=1671311 RepID=UPI0027D6EC8D|nr:uncharacterized protein CABS01_05832 [Colletotrichum abscissum]KAK1518298.1 hypothetical protein CABS01_05832 [Colletotrichum abscissum]